MNHTNITNFSSESLSPSSDEAKFPSDFVWEQLPVPIRLKVL